MKSSITQKTQYQESYETIKINPLHVIVPFLCPLKTSGGIKMEHWHEKD